MEDKELLKEAIQAATFAYIPYSKFAVGATLLRRWKNYSWLQYRK